MDAYYANESPLPLSAPERYRMAGAATKQDRAAVDYVVSKFFTEAADGWHQKRADNEIAAYQARADLARTNGAHGGRPRNRQITDPVISGLAKHNPDERVSKANQEPVTSNQEPEPIAAVSLPSVEKLPLKTVAATAQKAAPAAKLSPEKQGQARAVWQAYSDAYLHRYGTEPVRNGKTNAAVVQLLARLPADEAPHIAAHFVGSNAAFYVGKGHAITLLLADAEKLRTEWATNRRVTSAEARLADATQARGNVFGRLIDNAKDGTHG